MRVQAQKLSMRTPLWMAREPIAIGHPIGIESKYPALPLPRRHRRLLPVVMVMAMLLPRGNSPLLLLPRGEAPLTLPGGLEPAAISLVPEMAPIMRSAMIFIMRSPSQVPLFVVEPSRIAPFRMMRTPFLRRLPVGVLEEPSVIRYPIEWGVIGINQILDRMPYRLEWAQRVGGVEQKVSEIESEIGPKHSA